MVILEFQAKSFKKMEDPNDEESERIKYICYAKASTIPLELNDWMSTNPREQKMTTNVAKNIKESLKENLNFHELNRGIVLSVEKVTYDNKTGIVQIQLDNSEIHGNIDGGHTLRAIFELNEKQIMPDNRYVFIEMFTGIDSPVELASARNTSVQVDLKSIEELQKSFDVLKEIVKPLKFSSRIAYKMNEHYNEDGINPIDVREVLALISMYSQTLYPFKNIDGTLNDQQPIQCYTGKESTLKRFVNLDKLDREKMLCNMSDVIPGIFNIWEYIETKYAELSQKAGKRYTSRKYSKYSEKDIVSKSAFYEQEMHYMVPKGMIYPIVGAFRALIEIDENNKYKWRKPPELMLDKMASKLVGIVLDEKTDNPDVIGKNTNLWSNLFKEVYIEAYLI